MPMFPAEKLRQVSTTIFRAAGADPEPASIVADHLVDAHLAGHDSHGVLRIPSYVKSIRSGGIVPNARPEVVRETAVSALVDAKRTFGQVSALFGTDLAIAKAKEHGVGVVGVVHGNHIGRVGHYPTRAARQGVVLLVTVGGLGRSAVPFGGRAGALGTNPIAVGFPAAERPDFLLDFATSAIAGGKVMVARAKHEPVPANCLLDREGNPTTDPNAYFDGGMLLPFGGHKGYAFSVLTVLLSSVLVRPEGEEGEAGRGGRTFILGIDAGLFGPASAVEADADRAFGRLKDVPPAPGVDEVLVPGEPEACAAVERREHGIAVADDTWRELVATARDLGVSVET
ncbi:MAG: Ldh family oxidoreductase [Chloroflexota bacterium]